MSLHFTWLGSLDSWNIFKEFLLCSLNYITAFSSMKKYVKVSNFMIPKIMYHLKCTQELFDFFLEILKKKNVAFLEN